MKRLREKGAVSLFIVIFTALLLSIVTVSFVRLMVNEQQQATTSDLAQSAYDSAQAGVEDAKRLLVLDQACRNGTAASTVNCAAIASALTPVNGDETGCDTLTKAGIVNATDNETLIQQSAGDVDLDQAYTCVKIAQDTSDYLGDLAVNESTVIPLVSDGSFDQVVLSWFSDKDIDSSTNDLSVGFPSSSGDVTLPPVGARWQYNYPALMRAQVVQLGSNFKMNDFNDNADGRGNSNSLFLYPSETGATNKDYALDARRNSTNAPQPITCRDNLAGGGFACSVTLNLLDPINGGTANRNAYLYLTALYNKAHFSVALKSSSGGDIKFKNVQPLVDSTGRANNLFRRVVSRIELKGEFTYPRAELDVDGNLCKNFTVTSNASDYSASTTCNP